MRRFAIISARTDRPETIARYLPDNYEIVGEAKLVGDERLLDGRCVLIAGDDLYGWTLDDYVLPRLASGLIFGREVDLHHPIVKDLAAAGYVTLTEDEREESYAELRTLAVDNCRQLGCTCQPEPKMTLSDMGIGPYGLKAWISDHGDDCALTEITTNG